MTKSARKRGARRKRTRYPLEPQADQVIADYAGGMAQAELAAKYGVSRAAITSFLGRHVDAVLELQAKVRESLKGSAILTKKERVAELQRLYIECLEVLKRRRRDHPQTAAVEVIDVKVDNAGGEHTVIKFDAALVAQLRGLARDIAEEQGEIVRRSESVLSTPKDEDGNERPIPLIIYRTKSQPSPKP